MILFGPPILSNRFRYIKIGYQQYGSQNIKFRFSPAGMIA
ncbi:hypothetical protein D1AOALGA4SA_138 [Olavius algarvensis Delta 1 endosymbiont]|nr:hypothetical protein D1AOALGA4SA_138 [Olavius algarvensis Delta 1 endosymbiont]